MSAYWLLFLAAFHWVIILFQLVPFNPPGASGIPASDRLTLFTELLLPQDASVTIGDPDLVFRPPGLSDSRLSFRPNTHR
jgi:hypothetical protein